MNKGSIPKNTSLIALDDHVISRARDEEKKAKLDEHKAKAAEGKPLETHPPQKKPRTE